MATDHVLSAEDLKVVRKAVKCPAKHLMGEREKTFVRETRERIEKFKERTYLSAKQLEWLRKIASRMEGGNKKSADVPQSAKPNEPADFPSYDELVGE